MSQQNLEANADPQTIVNSGSISDNRFSKLFASQRAFFQSGETLAYEFRREQLAKLKETVASNKKQILEALHCDLHRPEAEALISEVAFVLEEIEIAEKNLKSWMKVEKVSSPWLFWPSKSKIISEPFGNALIIGPWNYPFQLVMAPLVASIAAGNTNVLKVSEFTTHTEKLLHSMISENFDERFLALVPGGLEESQALLKLPFEKMFFTGSSTVGKTASAGCEVKLVVVSATLSSTLSFEA